MVLRVTPPLGREHTYRFLSNALGNFERGEIVCFFKLFVKELTHKLT